MCKPGDTRTTPDRYLAGTIHVTVQKLIIDKLDQKTNKNALFQVIGGILVPFRVRRCVLLVWNELEKSSLRNGDGQHQKY